ncbi:hypothetical protein HK405_008081, partial [Cladochytrium tenue]
MDTMDKQHIPDYDTATATAGDSAAAGHATWIAMDELPPVDSADASAAVVGPIVPGPDRRHVIASIDLQYDNGGDFFDERIPEELMDR